MHLAVLFQHYTNPDCAATARHYALLERWTRQHRVSLVASNAWAERRRTRRFPWVPEGVELHGVDVPYRNGMGAGVRALAFGRFAAGALARAARLDAVDVFLGVSTPLTTPTVAALVARARGVPWVLQIEDLWPDFPIQMGAVPGRPARAALYGLERALYRDAAHVLTLSPGMTAHVAATTDPARVTTLYNGTDLPFVDASASADLAELRRAHGLGEGPVVLYAGTFGRANHVPLLIAVAERLAAREDGATLVCVGDGFLRPDLEAAAARLPSLRLVAPCPRPDVFPLFRVAALSLVSFIDLPVLGANSPAKLFDSLACGTPVVVTNDGWMRSLVDARGCGFYVPAADPDAPARIAALLDAPDRLADAGRRARSLVSDEPEMFDRRLQADVYEAIFERVVAERRG